MNVTSLEHYAARRTRRRLLAATLLASVAITALGVGFAAREPLRPLRMFARWSLESKGARFVANARARAQTSINDCGPTALADLLDLTGRAVPSADSLDRLASLKPNGTTLARIAAAAGVVGLPLFTVRWNPAELALLPLPSLVWVNRNHFVVVSRRSAPDSVEVHDPATGLYRIQSDRFARLWSGEALILLDSIISHRVSNSRSESRSLRARGTRATIANRMEN